MTGLRELNNISILFRIVLSIICGGVIGLERGVKGRAAGFRTHILVCMGSALTMMTGQYALIFFGSHTDPMRIGAQVVSGIGFLGVGTIITTKSQKVKGLTTAAGLWAAACLGLAIGIGFYEAALIGTFGVIIAMISFQRIDRFFYSKSKIRDYYIEVKRVHMIYQIMKMLKESGYQIIAMEYERIGRDTQDSMGMVVSIKRRKKGDLESVIEMLGNQPEILYVEEL